MTGRVQRGGFALLALFVLSSCEPHVPIGDNADIVESRVCVDPDEGHVLTIAGASVDIPSDALPYQQCLTLKRIGDLELPGEFDLLGPIVQVSAETGLNVERPYTLTMSYRGDPERVVVARYLGDGEWIRAGDVVLEQVVVTADTALLRTFYGGTLAVIDYPDAECLTDSDCIADGTVCDERFQCAETFCEGDDDCAEEERCGPGNECIEACEGDPDCEEGICLEDGSCAFTTCFDAFDCPDDQFCYIDEENFFDPPFRDEAGDDGEEPEGICIPIDGAEDFIDE